MLDGSFYGPARGRDYQWAARAVIVVAVALLVGLVAWSCATGGIFWTLVAGGSAEEKLSALRAFFERFGVAAPIVYLLLVVVEVVVAPIPGTMLYAPGGVLFGGFLGGTLSLAGNVIGAAVACLLVRGLVGERGADWMGDQSDESRGARARLAERITRHGTWIVFLLRVNPLTSSDLVSYATGLTMLPVWKLMLGTLAGMAPLCFAQSYLAEGLLSAFPSLVYPLVAACVVYGIVAVWVGVRLVKK